MKLREAENSDDGWKIEHSQQLGNFSRSQCRNQSPGPIVKIDIDETEERCCGSGMDRYDFEIADFKSANVEKNDKNPFRFYEIFD